MKVINLNSNFELSQAQISFTESVIICGEEYGPIYDSISILMNEIPIFLLNPESMPEFEKGQNEKTKPPTEWLGFYQHSSPILGVKTPLIGLCPERIIDQVANDEELIVLIAKIIIHEFAHAKMTPDPSANYNPFDEFYKWMEEPMANAITLEYFRNFGTYYRHRRNRGGHFAYVKTKIDPFDFVKGFISNQPDNYRLGLDLFRNRLSYKWRIWRDNKDKMQNMTKEKNDWLNYVKTNVGKTDNATLRQLFDALDK